jgi:cytochrome P450
MTQETEAAGAPARMFGPEMLADPYPVYHRLRRFDPVHWHAAHGGWVLSRYADVAALLRNPHVSSERMRAEAERGPAQIQALFTFRANSMLNADPPRHTRLRLLVSKAFTPGAVEQLAPFIQRTVDEALDAVQAAGRMDVIRDLANRLPITVIAHMLGVPPEDRDRFKDWADKATAVVGNLASNLQEEEVRRAVEAVGELKAYLQAVVAERRARPRDDLLSALVRAEEQGDWLTEDELFSNAVLLLNAGHETTTNLIGNGVHALLRHPDQWKRLRDDPSLVPTAVEEFLRFDGPVQFTSRVLKDDLTVGGKHLKAGQSAVLLLGAANRDPAQFKDPDRLDVGRPDNKHVAFGLGPHFCLGAPLARLEGKIVFETLLRRFPGLRAEGPPPEYRANFNLRGLVSLPAAW